MGNWAKIISTTALFASFTFAQTYDLPIVFIDTKNKCLDQNVTEKIPATMSVLDAATNNVADSAKGTHYDIGIKVRGQSSAKFPKPGYSVEVRDEKGEGMDVSMFGLPPGDDWVFHGPYVDKSLMRNALAHWLFRQAGHYSPRSRHFDLYINGVYRGVYVLLETNTGGMGMEDINKEGFSTADGLNVIMHYPKKENLQTQQQAYLKKYLEDLENLFKNGKNGSGYENYVDMTSALDYVLHEEVTNNSDSYWCSFFLHKPKDSKGGKVTLGPAWDFNLAMSNGGGMGSTTTDGWQIENPQKQGQGGMMMMGGGLKAPNWLIGMWKDSHYQSELKKRWAELRSGVWHTKTMDVYLDSMKAYLTKAADRNFKRWPNLGQGSGQGDPDPEPMKFCNQSQGGQNQNPWGMWGGGGGGITMGGNNANTWDGEFEHLRKKMKERMAWMDRQLGFTEPAQPIVTEPVIHDPDWKKDSVTQSTYRNVQMENLSRLSPTNYFAVNGDHLEIQTSLGGMFALVDLNGTVLYKTRIGKGLTTLKVPAKAMNRHWIATLNGKMLGR